MSQRSLGISFNRLATKCFLVSTLVFASGGCMFASDDGFGVVTPSFTGSGSVDSDFEDKIVAFLDPAGLNRQVYSMKLDPLGRIVMAGSQCGNECPEVFFARFDTGGNLDSSFGTGGVQRMDPNSDMILSAPFFQDVVYDIDFLRVPSGVITYALIGFECSDCSPYTGNWIIKLNENGTRDINFGSGGYALAGDGTDFASLNLVRKRIAVTENTLFIAENECTAACMPESNIVNISGHNTNTGAWLPGSAIVGNATWPTTPATSGLRLRDLKRLDSSGVVLSMLHKVDTGASQYYTGSLSRLLHNGSNIVVTSNSGVPTLMNTSGGLHPRGIFVKGNGEILTALDFSWDEYLNGNTYGLFGSFSLQAGAFIQNNFSGQDNFSSFAQIIEQSPSPYLPPIKKNMTPYAGIAYNPQSGKTIMAGIIKTQNDGGGLAVARYNTNGTLDSSFGPTKSPGMNAIYLDFEGEVAIVGEPWNSQAHQEEGIMQVLALPDGSAVVSLLLELETGDRFSIVMKTVP